MKYENEIFYTHGHFALTIVVPDMYWIPILKKQKWEYYSLLNLYMNMCNDTIGKSIVPAPKNTTQKFWG